jgi:hypothetical protein
MVLEGPDKLAEARRLQFVVMVQLHQDRARTVLHSPILRVTYSIDLVRMQYPDPVIGRVGLFPEEVAEIFAVEKYYPLPVVVILRQERLIRPFQIGDIMAWREDANERH